MNKFDISVQLHKWGDIIIIQCLEVSDEIISFFNSNNIQLTARESETGELYLFANDREMMAIDDDELIGTTLTKVYDQLKAELEDGYDMSIHYNPDAAAWARFFKETFPESDEEVMEGWFANAMMAMHDHVMREYVQPLHQHNEELQRIVTDPYYKGL